MHDQRRNINDLGTRQFERAMNVMAQSVFYAIKYGSQAMAVTSTLKPQSAGAIIVTASVAAVLGGFSDLAYCKSPRHSISQMELTGHQQRRRVRRLDWSTQAQ